MFLRSKTAPLKLHSDIVLHFLELSYKTMKYTYLLIPNNLTIQKIGKKKKVTQLSLQAGCLNLNKSEVKVITKPPKLKETPSVTILSAFMLPKELYLQ